MSGLGMVDEDGSDGGAFSPQLRQVQPTRRANYMQGSNAPQTDFVVTESPGGFPSARKSQNPSYNSYGAQQQQQQWRGQRSTPKIPYGMSAPQQQPMHPSARRSMEVGPADLDIFREEPRTHRSKPAKSKPKPTPPSESSGSEDSAEQEFGRASTRDKSKMQERRSAYQQEKTMEKLRIEVESLNSLLTESSVNLQQRLDTLTARVTALEDAKKERLTTKKCSLMIEERLRDVVDASKWFWGQVVAPQGTEMYSERPDCAKRSSVIHLAAGKWLRCQYPMIETEDYSGVRFVWVYTAFCDRNSAEFQYYWVKLFNMATKEHLVEQFTFRAPRESVSIQKTEIAAAEAGTDSD